MKPADRQAREAAALRANLLKRKEQMRQRQAPQDGRVLEAPPAEAEDMVVDETKQPEA